jgi:cyclopropane fatty-acyl-phospholipid synthase-like methyltransferase
VKAQRVERDVPRRRPRRRQTYGSSFYAAQSDGSRQSAAVVVPLIKALLEPRSVLDVGCGLGTWLAEWARCGVADIMGVDGEYVKPEALQIPTDCFTPYDLSKPMNLERRFDLVQSLEVAEHIEAGRADEFVRSLCAHGDYVLFSAAIPGQRGSGHVNEQFPSYWIDKFSNLGFSPHDCVRPAVWNDRQVESWYRQNMLLFSRSDVPVSVVDDRFDLVHPDVWATRHDLTLRELLKSLPGAVDRGVRAKLNPS